MEKTRSVRWWPLLVIIGLVIASLISLQFSTDLEGNFKSMRRFLTFPIAGALMILWLMFFSRLRWKIRFLWLGIVILLIIGLAQLLRFDGTADGSGTVKLAWKWAPKKDGNVTGFKTVAAKAASPQLTNDFPGFLGADRRGILPNVAFDPNWSSRPPKEIWRQQVGLGWSAFAISGERAITQEQRGAAELVVCYDLTSGGVFWAHTNLVRFSEALGGDGPRSTPTIADGRVYALGATGILDCLDLASGRLIWSRDTLQENQLPNLIWAKSCAPLLVDDLVIVSGGMTNGSSLLAYKRENGAPAWRAGQDKASYSSPTLATLAGKPQILSINAASVTGHDPATGRILWDYTWGTDKWPKCAQPLLLEGDRVFISAGYGLGCVMLQVKNISDDKFSVSELWKNRSMKSQFSNIVVRDGFLYGLDDGILACVDLKTGERKWKDGRYGHGQVLLAGDVLLVQTEPGPVVLVEAKPSEFHEIARLDALRAKTWNVPAIAGDFLLVRNDQEAVCYQLPVAQKIN